MSGYSDSLEKLSKGDLRAFDDEAMVLVDRMQAAGWRGRKAKSGHLVMYAPDGVSSLTVSRSSLRGRSGRNAKAVFDRWEREQGSKPSEKETDAVKRHICDHPGCGEEFASDRSLGIHKAKHAREKVKCPRCGREVVYLDSHMQRFHRVNTSQLLDQLIETFDELERLREEHAALVKENVRLRRARKDP